MTEEETRTVLNILATNYRNFIKPSASKAAILMTWAQAFKDVPPEDAMNAVCSYIQRNKFPPTVADIYELLPFRDNREKYNIGADEKMSHMQNMYAWLQMQNQEARNAD